MRYWLKTSNTDRKCLSTYKFESPQFPKSILPKQPNTVLLILLCVGSNPVDDAVLIKVVLMSKYEALSFSQFPHKNERRALKVVPLLCYLYEDEEKSLSILADQKKSLISPAAFQFTIFSRYCSRDSTVARGSIFNMRPVRSIRAVSPGARSKRKRSRLVKIWQTSAVVRTPESLTENRRSGGQWLTCRLYEDPGVS